MAITAPSALAIKSYIEPDRQGKKNCIISIKMPKLTENKKAKYNCAFVILLRKYDVGFSMSIPAILKYIIACTILSALGTSVLGNTPMLITESINTRVHTNIVGRYFIIN